MNRRNDGVRLTVDDLVAIARDAGFDDDAIAAAMIGRTVNVLDKLRDLTRNARFDLFMAGKLALDTRAD